MTTLKLTIPESLLIFATDHYPKNSQHKWRNEQELRNNFIVN